LQEETVYRPKAMVEIGGKPILWHIMRYYRHFGVRRFIICLGYRGNDIRDYFLNYRNHNSDIEIDLSNGAIDLKGTPSQTTGDDWNVILAETGQDSQTGARIKKILPYIENDRFFATYGDGVADVDLAALLQQHMEHEKQATVTAVHPSSRFGELDINKGLARSFVEKPQVQEGWINGGFFVFEKSAFSNTPNQDDLVLESGVLEKLASSEQLAVYAHTGFWQCMDTVRENQLLNEVWRSGAAPWNVWK